MRVNPDLLIVPKRQRHYPALAQQLLEHPAFSNVAHFYEIAPAELICGTTRVAKVVSALAEKEIKSVAYENQFHSLVLAAGGNLHRRCFVEPIHAQYARRAEHWVRVLLQELFTVDADIARIILIELRIPRACLAMLVGASLGLAGAAMQGLLRNPLAEPGVVGVSGTAALGATLTFYTGLASVAPLALPLGGIAGALAAVILLFIVAGKYATHSDTATGRYRPKRHAGALTTLTLNLSPNPFAPWRSSFGKWVLWRIAACSICNSVRR
ncbi:MAG: hypothetical protein CM15mP120_24550 [Pseudomonadota bacterium]|nr:MAG: hypothetical protein CM15mP120_24550 [Pseudomonadota bacterium]